MTSVSVDYMKAHKQPRGLWGQPTDHGCATCWNTAKQWAYQHTAGANEKVCKRSGYKFSLDPEDYAPMCVSCHRKLDYLVDPEKRKVKAEQLAKARSTPQFKSAVTSAAKNLAESNKKRLASDPVFLEKYRQQGRNAASVSHAKKILCDCGMEITVSNYKRHLAGWRHR